MRAFLSNDQHELDDYMQVRVPHLAVELHVLAHLVSNRLQCLRVQHCLPTLVSPTKEAIFHREKGEAGYQGVVVPLSAVRLGAMLEW